MVKFYVEIFGTPLFQNGTPIFQMGLLFLEKEESRTPTFEIQVRTLCMKQKKLSHHTSYFFGAFFFFFFFFCSTRYFFPVGAVGIALSRPT